MAVQRQFCSELFGKFCLHPNILPVCPHLGSHDPHLGLHGRQISGHRDLGSFFCINSVCICIIFIQICQNGLSSFQLHIAGECHCISTFPCKFHRGQSCSAVFIFSCSACGNEKIAALKRLASLYNHICTFGIGCETGLLYHNAVLCHHRESIADKIFHLIIFHICERKTKPLSCLKCVQAIKGDISRILSVTHSQRIGCIRLSITGDPAQTRHINIIIIHCYKRFHMESHRSGACQQHAICCYLKRHRLLHRHRFAGSNDISCMVPEYNHFLPCTGGTGFGRYGNGSGLCILHGCNQRSLIHGKCFRICRVALNDEHGAAGSISL